MLRTEHLPCMPTLSLSFQDDFTYKGSQDFFKEHVHLSQQVDHLSNQRVDGFLDIRKPILTEHPILSNRIGGIVERVARLFT